MRATPAWIRWPGILAWMFFAVLPLAVLTVRSGQWQQGLLLFAIACVLSLALAGYFGLLSLLPALAEHRRRLGLLALPTLPGALLLVLAMSASDLPAIHDISTDTANPPRFETVPTLRDPAANSLAIDAEVIALQEAAYPDLQTLYSAQSYPAVYAAAMDTARAMGWEIVRDDPNGGFIEAIARTRIMNFTDDIVLRIGTGAQGSRVDMRSASRVGISDLGANAKRIGSYMKRLRETLGES